MTQTLIAVNLRGVLFTGVLIAPCCCAASLQGCCWSLRVAFIFAARNRKFRPLRPHNRIPRRPFLVAPLVCGASRTRNWPSFGLDWGFRLCRIAFGSLQRFFFFSSLEQVFSVSLWLQIDHRAGVGATTLSGGPRAPKM